MPVEIKELVIRAIAHKDTGCPAPAATAAAPIADDREAIVAAAVKEVLRILKAAKER